MERLADGTRRAVQGALEALAALCKRQEFVELLHASPSGWLQVVPLLRDSSAPVEAAAALVLARACARAPEVSPVVAELGASGALLELVTAPEGACSMGTREAAAEALMACSTTAAFQQEMSQSGAHGGIDAMVAMLNHATPHKLLLCISRAVEHALRHDAAKLADVFSAHPCLLETLIDLWYARTGECQEAVEGVLWLVLAEESGAKYLTSGVEEEQLAKFLEDFKALDRARAAAATGGASLQRDADEEYTALGEFQSEATTRDALANRFDCVKAARYMRTLLPPKPTVAVLGDKTGALTCNLAEALAGQSMEAFCYCALETRMWAEFVESRAGSRELKRLIGVVKTDSASDVTALPVPVDLIVVSCNAYAEIFCDEVRARRAPARARVPSGRSAGGRAGRPAGRRACPHARAAIILTRNRTPFVCSDRRTPSSARSRCVRCTLDSIRRAKSSSSKSTTTRSSAPRARTLRARALRFSLCPT